MIVLRIDYGGRARLKQWCNHHLQACLHIPFLCTIGAKRSAEKCKAYGGV